MALEGGGRRAEPPLGAAAGPWSRHHHALPSRRDAPPRAETRAAPQGGSAAGWQPGPHLLPVPGPQSCSRGPLGSLSGARVLGGRGGLLCPMPLPDPQRGGRRPGARGGAGRSMGRLGPRSARTCVPRKGLQPCRRDSWPGAGWLSPGRPSEREAQSPQDTGLSVAEGPRLSRVWPRMLPVGPDLPAGPHPPCRRAGLVALGEHKRPLTVATHSPRPPGPPARPWAHRAPSQLPRAQGLGRQDPVPWGSRPQTGLLCWFVLQLLSPLNLFRPRTETHMEPGGRLLL